MKKLIYTFLAAFLFMGGKAVAEEPTVRGASNYRLYSSSNVTLGTNKIANSAFLHKVIISSAAGGTSYVDFYDSQGGATNKKFTVQVDSNNVTPSEIVFDTYFSSGLTTSFISAHTTASVQAIYKPGGVAQDYRVWQSTFMVAQTSTQTIANGPVLLHKVIVLKKGAGTAILNIFNQQTAAAVTANRVASIDLVGRTGEYEFNIMLSSGLVFCTPSIGSTAPEYVILYKKNPPRDWEYWNVYHPTATWTAKNIFAGRGQFGGVLNGDIDATSALTIYDTVGQTSKIVAGFMAQSQFDRLMYDVTVSSGLTFTNTGSGTWSILWRRLR